MKAKMMTMMEMWRTVASTIASFMFFWAMIRRYCPPELRRRLEKYTKRLMTLLDPYIQITIHEYVGRHLSRNQAYGAVEAYLGGFSTKTAKKLQAQMGNSPDKLVFSMDEYEKVKDEFQGAEVWWVLSKSSSSRSTIPYYPEPERRYYRLKFHQKDKKMIMEDYLRHVVTAGKENLRKKRQKKLFLNSSSTDKSLSRRSTSWSHIAFNHPATFEAIAMEAEKKQEIIEDLLAFKESKDFYARIGKTWKRGYLLYGPPGTGKSTMIAAMANLLDYDVYDLELTAVKDNTELKRLLIETTSKSIIVIEDIDCSLDLTGQKMNRKERSSKDGDEKVNKRTSKEAKEDSSTSEVTLSGLLNFIDGLWSACGGERIIVFTTNHLDKLDPALTRRGRMDKHIELSYCSFEGFKVLAKNYLNLDMHPMFEQIEKLMGSTKITPADVAENLMPKSRTIDAERCLSYLIQALDEAADNSKKQELKETPTAKFQIQALDEAADSSKKQELKETPKAKLHGEN